MAAQEEETDQTPSTPSKPPTFPIDYSSDSSWSLPGDFKYPVRPYGGATKPELEESSRPNVRYVAGRSARQFPSGRGGRRFERDVAEATPDSYKYDGPNLIGQSGLVEQGPYSLDSSSIVGELVGIGNAAQRRVILKTLYALGFYESKTGPSMTGTQSRDISAFRQLLLTANSQGYTWDIVLSTIINDPEYAKMAKGYASGGGGGGRLGTDNELAMVFANATHNMLGRAPTNKEIDQYIRAYRSGGMSASATAETIVSEKSGPEEDAYGYAQMAELMNKMIGGG